MAEKEREKAQQPTPGRSGAESGGRFSVHKPGEGYATRLGTLLVALCFVLFACHHWYYFWGSLRDFASKFLGLSSVLSWTNQTQTAEWISRIGAGAIFLVGMGIAYYYVWIQPRASDFLVKTDVELTKVTWPKISPWLRPETQVWGATYAVLIVMLVLTAYIFGVDWILNLISNWIFYSG